jgi:methyl-accepting chemotaxis protein
MAVLTGVVGYKGVTAAGELNAMMNELYNKHTMGISVIHKANALRINIGRDVRTAMLVKDKAEKQQKAEAIAKQFTELDEALGDVEKILVTEEGKARLAKIRDANADYKRLIDNLLTLTLAGKDDEAVAALQGGGGIVREFDGHFKWLVDAKERLGKEAFEESSAAYAKLRTTLFTIIGAGILFSLGLGYFIAQLISKPLQATVEVLARVAEGDLTARLDIDTKDEVGEMASALNRATEAMRTTLSDVRKSADHMSMSAQQLASASEQLASGAQEQASSLEETSATMEEITSTIKQNADNAKQANQVANGSKDTAEKGGQVVAEAVTAMGKINESSKNIAEIITTIDEIAFQTNLLALNAAVEAARAGEQGRGFAVVATEVRNLAQRSATSAKEIKRLIQDSVSKVENGSALVNKSGETLREIVGSVKRVNDIVAEIAAASQEQSTGVEQVNKAMVQMDQVTQANSSQTEELSATAQTMAAGSQQLQAMVARFRLDANGTRQMAHGQASSMPAVKPAPAEAHVGQPPRKPLARRAAAAAGGAGAAISHTTLHHVAPGPGDELNNPKGQSNGFEEF